MGFDSKFGLLIVPKIFAIFIPTSLFGKYLNSRTPYICISNVTAMPYSVINYRTSRGSTIRSLEIQYIFFGDRLWGRNLFGSYPDDRQLRLEKFEVYLYFICGMDLQRIISQKNRNRHSNQNFSEPNDLTRPDGMINVSYSTGS